MNKLSCTLHPAPHNTHQPAQSPTITHTIYPQHPHNTPHNSTTAPLWESRNES